MPVLMATYTRLDTRLYTCLDTCLHAWSCDEERPVWLRGPRDKYAREDRDQPRDQLPPAITTYIAPLLVM